jgi:hypothetical protein
LFHRYTDDKDNEKIKQMVIPEVLPSILKELKLNNFGSFFLHKPLSAKKFKGAMCTRAI